MTSRIDTGRRRALRTAVAIAGRAYSGADLLADPVTSTSCGGRLEHALGSIKAKATVLASQTDLYFTVPDMKADAAMFPQARFRVIASLWDHRAGSGLNPAHAQFIEREIKALLAAIRRRRIARAQRVRPLSLVIIRSGASGHR